MRTSYQNLWAPKVLVFQKIDDEFTALEVDDLDHSIV